MYDVNDPFNKNARKRSVQVGILRCKSMSPQKIVQIINVDEFHINKKFLYYKN